MPAISIITPVYNTEKYLIKCLDSIKAQTFSDFEVILIDDGSTDASPKILDDYAKTDTRFKVFHKKNEGVTKARKDGIKHATGTFIVWVDSDDWIEETHLEHLYKTVTEDDADICVCNFVKENQNGITKYEEIIDDLSHPLSSLIEKETCRGTLWTKIAKKALFTKKNVFPPESIHCWEDVIISANIYYHSQKTIHIPIYTYHVNDMNQTSLTRSKQNSKKNMHDKIDVVKYFEENEKFKKLDLTYMKYDVKYYALLQNFIIQKIIPSDFYRLYSDIRNYKVLKRVLRDENVDSKIRFIEFFLILANIKILAAPLHFILATMRNRTASVQTERKAIR